MKSKKDITNQELFTVLDLRLTVMQKDMKKYVTEEVDRSLDCFARIVNAGFENMQQYFDQKIEREIDGVRSDLGEKISDNSTKINKLDKKISENSVKIEDNYLIVTRIDRKVDQLHDVTVGRVVMVENKQKTHEKRLQKVEQKVLAQMSTG